MGRLSACWPCLLSMFLNAAVFPATATADRRNGLAGNRLIEDPDDAFLFPQLVTRYRDRIYFDYGGTAAEGNAGLSLGMQDWAFGATVHRGDLLSPDVVDRTSELRWLSGVGDPFNGALTPAAPGDGAAEVLFADPATVVDLMAGTQLNDTSSVGLRLGVGRGANWEATGDKTGDAQTFVMGQGGFSTVTESGLRADVAVDLLMDFGVQKAAGVTTDRGRLFRAGGSVRLFNPLTERLQLGVLGDLSLTNSRVIATDQEGDPDRKVFDVGAALAAGPVIDAGRALVAAHAQLRFGVGRLQDGVDTPETTTVSRGFAVPGVLLSAEIALRPWLMVRSGAEYLFNATGRNVEVQLEDGAEDTTSREVTGAFGWNAGLGVRVDGFAFDGVVRQGFVTDGPDFVGGTAPGFLAMASMRYHFGDVLSELSAADGDAEAAAPGEATETDRVRPVSDWTQGEPTAPAEPVDKATDGSADAPENGADEGAEPDPEKGLTE